MSEIVLNSEEEYKHICSSLRQLVAGWASVRTNYRGDLEDIHTFFQLERPSWKLSSSEKEKHLWMELGKGYFTPSSNAELYLHQLDQLRKLRIRVLDLVLEHEKQKQEQSFPQVLKRYLPTLICRALNLLESSEPSDTMQKISQLDAHNSPKSTSNTTLYKEVLRSHLYWGHSDRNSKEFSTQNVTKLSLHVLYILSRMEKEYQAGNPNIRPDRESINLVLQSTKHSKNFAVVQSITRLLTGSLKDVVDASTMKRLLVLLLICTRKGSVGEKRSAVDIAMSLLKRVDQLAEDSGGGKNNFRDEAYGLTFRIIGNAGEECFPDYFDKVESLLKSLVGEEKYRQSLRTDDGPTKGLEAYNYRTLDYLIQILAKSSDDRSIERAKSLLILSDQARRQNGDEDHKKENRPNELNWDYKFPRLQSYNAVLLAMLRRCRLDGGMASDKQYVENLYRTIRGRSSLDLDLNFYHLLLRVMQHVLYNDATDLVNTKDNLAEEGILDDIEIRNLSSLDKQIIPVPYTYECVLDNLAKAAKLGRLGIIHSANKLMKRLESTCKLSQLKWDKHDGEVMTEINAIYRSQLQSKQDMSQLYLSYLKVCSSTTNKIDQKSALDYAFNAFNSMIERDIPRTPHHYAELLLCCSFDSMSRSIVLERSKAIFTEACKERKVNGRLLHTLKKVNYPLFKVYEQRQQYIE